MNEQANRALAEALRLAEHGYRLTPVTITRDPDSGKKLTRWHYGKRVNGRWVGGWRHEEAWSNDPDQIKAWWTDHPDTSFALGGAANGIEGVDLDVKTGVNAVEWWATQGLPLSPLTQWTPSGGAHLIWSTGPERALPQDVARLAPGVDTRNRGGLFFAAGGYVVGEQGHYEVAGDLPKLVDLVRTPPVVLDLFASAAGHDRPDRATDGRIVPHDIEWQRDVTAKALQAIRDHDRDAGGYRKLLQGAGLPFGRVVEQNALYPTLTRERAEAAILDAHRSVWGDVVYPENLVTIRDALADGPRLERWRVPAALPTIQDNVQDHVQRSSPVEPNNDLVTDGVVDDKWPGETGYDPDANAERDRLKADAAAIEKERRSRMARRVVAAEERDPVRILSGLAFLDGPDLDYLVPSLFYRASTAKVYGPPGGTKSFLLLDLVLSLATGRPWRGQRLGRYKVHYVMAEGEPVNRLRAKGWLHHHDVDPAELDGWLTVVPQGVLLTPEGVADYVVQVEADGPALVVLDTKNAMMEGDESSASDVAVLVRAMRAIRDAAGGACVVLVDHTGLNDETRARGSGAVTGAMDTEVLVTFDSTGLASAKVSRDKGSESGYTIHYRLQAVEDVPRKPGVRAPSVCVEALRGETGDPFNMDEDWFAIAVPLPEDVATYKGKGARAVPALARFMRYSASTGAGFSFASARKAIQARCRDDQGRRPLFSDDTVERAWDALEGLGRLQLGAAKGSPAAWLTRAEDPK